MRDAHWRICACSLPSSSSWALKDLLSSSQTRGWFCVWAARSSMGHACYSYPWTGSLEPRRDSNCQTRMRDCSWRHLKVKGSYGKVLHRPWRHGERELLSSERHGWLLGWVIIKIEPIKNVLEEVRRRDVRGSLSNSSNDVFEMILLQLLQSAQISDALIHSLLHFPVLRWHFVKLLLKFSELKDNVENPDDWIIERSFKLGWIELTSWD